jgi:hypothetical protein
MYQLIKFVKLYLSIDNLPREELWICGDAVEDFSGVGAHHARTIYRSNNRKPEEPPQNERVNQGLTSRATLCGTIPDLWQAWSFTV